MSQGARGSGATRALVIALVAFAWALAVHIPLVPGVPDFRIQKAVALLTVLLAGCFAIALSLRPLTNAATQNLSLMMGLLALGLVLVQKPEAPVHWLDWLAPQIGSIGLAAIALAGAAFARFCVSFPRDLAPEEFIGHSAQTRRSSGGSGISPLFTGWLKVQRSMDARESRTIRKWDAAIHGALSSLIQRLPKGPAILQHLTRVARGEQDEWARLRLPWRAWWIAAAACALAVILSLAGYPKHAAAVLISTAGVLWLIGFIVATQGYPLMNERELRQSAWLVNSVFLSFSLLCVINMLGMLAGVSLTLTAEFAGGLGDEFELQQLAGTLLAHGFATAVVVGSLVLIVSLAIAVFKDGSLDPALALRATTLYAALALVLGLLFVLIEGLLYYFAVARLGMSSQLAPIIAGATITFGIGPLRRHLERRLHRWIQRLMPASALANAMRTESAVVFSDLTGYTAISATDERAALTLAALFHKEAEKAAQRHGGRLVKTIGDAVLLDFPAADQALVAAEELMVRFQSACDVLNLPSTPLRTGIHAGEVVRAHDGDLYGAVVNLAARLETSAAPGEIVVSRSVVDALPANVVARLEALGERSLKNVPQPVERFRLTLAPAG